MIYCVRVLRRGSNDRVRWDLGGAVALLLLLAGCGPGRVQQTANQGETPGKEVAEPCQVRETSRSLLILEGGQVAYVEPTVLRRSANGDFLLAGRHNYRFERSGDSTWSRVAGDSLLGAVVPRAGSPRPIFAPFPTARLNGVRAVELEGGRWAVVFAEVPPVPAEVSRTVGEIRPDSAIRLWYGVVDEGKWATLESVPMPVGGGKLEPANASSLVRHGENLAWAMILTPPMERSRIIVYEFKDGRWSYEEVPTFATEVELAHSDSLGLLLAVVQPDPRLRSDSNSLLLWARQPAWRILRSVVPGSRERVLHPSLRFTPAGAVLGWIASVPRPDGSETMEMHAVMGKITERDETVIVLDTDVGPFDVPIGLDMPGTSPLWIVDHRHEGSGEREIRFLHPDGAVPAVAGSIRNPYITHFAAQALSDSEVLITGGVLDSAEQYVGSLLIRARMVCGSDTR